MMVASDNLNPQQFMPIEQFKALGSEHGGSMADVEHGMQKNWDAWESGSGEHRFVPSYEERSHGGPKPYIDHLTADIAKNGLREPIKIYERSSVDDGHHRAAAVLRLGMKQIPVRHTDRWGNES